MIALAARRRALAFVVMAAAATGVGVHACQAQTQRETLALTAEQWKQDIAFFAAELPKRHKNAFHHISRERFTREVAALDAAVATLQPNEIVVRMLALTAQVGDIHTRLVLPASFRRYPISVEWFGDELRVTAAAAPYSAALGARILGIGGTGTGEIRTRINALIPQAENEWTLLALSPAYLVRPEILHALRIVPGLEATAFRLERDGGETLALQIAGTAAPMELLPAVPPTPLYRQRPDEQFWFTSLPATATVYVRFRGYDAFAKHAAELLTFVDSRRARRLVIDMRGNTGGDFTKVRERLVPGLKTRAATLAGNIYVIIDRRTLSAAMTNAADLKQQLNAVLVGEPTGERPNSYQEGREMTLPNSGLRIFYSTRYYKALPHDAPGVLPDIRIETSWSDYKAGRDPSLGSILAGPALSAAASRQ